MNISYDPEADAVYIRLLEKISPGQAKEQSDLIDIKNKNSQIIFDFDTSHNLIGIEILFASEILPKSFLYGSFKP